MWVFFAVQRDEAMKRREQEREDMVLQRKKDAEDSKKRMLAMYDQMAKHKNPDGNPLSLYLFTYTITNCRKTKCRNSMYYYHPQSWSVIC